MGMYDDSESKNLLQNYKQQFYTQFSYLEYVLIQLLSFSTNHFHFVLRLVLLLVLGFFLFNVI